jgi:hypothetical protein
MDLAALDFVLFGHVKRMLMESQVESLSELLVGLRVILSEIPREELNEIFLDYIERLQKYIDINKKIIG